MHLVFATVLAALVAMGAALEEPEAVEIVGEGRTFDEWAQSFWRWMGYEDEDYYDYDYGFQPSGATINYGLPQVGYIPASAGGVESTYSSYNPYAPVSNHLGHPARDDTFEEESSITDMMWDMAVTLVPVVVLLSALPAGMFTVALRRRSLDDNLLDAPVDPSELPLLRTLLESDFLALANRDCQEKLFCELTQLGENENASIIQRAMFYVATLTPDFLARRVGLQRVFRTSRAGSCEVLTCGATRQGIPQVLLPPSESNHVEEMGLDSEKETLELSKV